MQRSLCRCCRACLTGTPWLCGAVEPLVEAAVRRGISLSPTVGPSSELHSQSAALASTLQVLVEQPAVAAAMPADDQRLQ